MMETGNYELDYKKHKEILARCPKDFLEKIQGKEGILMEFKDGSFEFYES